MTVVRGNNDRDGECALYPDAEWLELAGRRVRLTHVVKVPAAGSAGLAAYLGADVVVYGHSHIAFQERRGPVLFFNPGAAGKRRFKVVPSVGLLELGPGGAEGRIIPL